MPLPTLKRWSLLFRTPGGQIVDLTLLWLTARAWSQRPESTEREWLSVKVGPFRIAIRMTF